MARRLFLIGYMAAGKTTLGRWAARRLGYDFIDLDHYIESRYMKSVSDLFAERGEEGFREIERRMLYEVGEFDRVLISTGGGTPCFFDNMDYMLSQGLTVYLEASVPVLCRRLKCSHTKRPLVDSKTEEELAGFVAEMLTRRDIYYRRAHAVFNSDEYERGEALQKATERLSSLLAQETSAE